VHHERKKKMEIRITYFEQQKQSVCSDKKIATIYKKNLLAQNSV